jgi:DNA polymerase-3 subunit epsilon
MVLGSPSEPLSQLEVLVVDCQATAAAPRGHLLEIGWARVLDTTITHARASLIALPDGEQIPPAVARITGISEPMMRAAVDGRCAWRELTEQAASLTQQPAPTVIHFARFEQPFLRTLAAGVFPLDVVCTRDIARRLLPHLPRCSLRALAGYFGRAVGGLRRSADHVEATAFVWHELVSLLERLGVSTWGALHDWLAGPPPIRCRRRIWPMPRDERLSLPAAPGIYRLLRTDGSVLYVGKAASLHHRVNSYFRKQAGVPERLLEMLSQARAISFDVTPSPLEAALLEADEIKRHRPPYNVALTTAGRALWFTSPDLSARCSHPSPHCPFGPFASAETLDQFAALARAGRAALTPGSRGPDDRTFTAGYDRLCATHAELSRGFPSPGPLPPGDLSDSAKLLRLGTRLWREGRRDRDPSEDNAEDEDHANRTRRGVTVWTPEFVQVSLEWLALRAALARRRAIWLTLLFDSSVVWREPGDGCARLMVIENGEVVLREAVDAHGTPPIPPGYRRPAAARREAFTLGSFDRLRVLTTELKRLVAAGAPVALRLHVGPALDESRLASALWWV